MKTSSRPGRHARLARAATAVLLIGLAGALAAGCSKIPARDLLARVGDRTVTADDFNAAAKDNAAQYPFAPDSAKHALLDDMVRRELLLAEGHRLGYDKDTAVVHAVQSAEGEVLSRALLERVAPANVSVSDSEVAQLHKWRATKAHLLLLYTPARNIAEQALAEIKAGKPFGEVSSRVSLPGVLPPGGDVGWAVAGQMVDPLDGIVRDAPVGVPQGPLPSPSEGWFLALVSERQTQTTGTLEEEKPFLTDMIRQRKQRANALKAFQQLRQEYKVQVDPRGPQALYQIGNAPTDKPQPQIDPHTVIGTYDGGTGAKGTYTLGDAMRDLADPGRGERPPFSSTAALQAWIDSQVLQRVAVIEARRRKLDQEPDVARRLRARGEIVVLQRVYEEKVAKGLDISEAEVLAHYAARAAAFARPDSTGKTPATPEFSTLPQPLQQNLRQEALMQKRDERLRTVTAQLQAATRPFEVHAERLKPLAWPAPPAMPGMSGGMPQGHP